MQLGDLQVYINDKASRLPFPYASVEQPAVVEELSDFSARDLAVWGKADTLRYFREGSRWPRPGASNHRVVQN
jgi:hypothetical protein